jgi:MFS family permease
MYSSVSRSDDVDGRSGSGSVATAAPRNSCCGIVRQHRPRWTNAICLLTAFIFAVNGGVLLVVIPTLAREFDTTIEVAAWTNIAPMFISAMIATQMGKIADQYGRARMWHVGMTLELLSHAASGGAQSMGQLLIARVVGGLGMGVGAGSAFGLMAAGLPPKQRGVAAAWLMLMGTLGRTSGTSIGTSYCAVIASLCPQLSRHGDSLSKHVDWYFTPDPLCQRFRCLPLHNKRYFQSGASAQEGS